MYSKMMDNDRRAPSPFQEVSTASLYNQWASTYDSDGNVLQFVDDLELSKILPHFVSLVVQQAKDCKVNVLRLLDLGCGTGRNTLKLAKADWSPVKELQVSGWDSSKAMLGVAQSKLETQDHVGTTAMPVFAQFDLADGEMSGEHKGSFNGITSTLVLEHVDINVFFRTLSSLSAPGGYCLITNMHEDMAQLSKAGFKTPSGHRCKGQSYIYSTRDMAQAAAAAGLEVVGDIKERAVEAVMIEGGMIGNVFVEKGRVAERAAKWVGTKIWMGMIVRKPDH